MLKNIYIFSFSSCTGICGRVILQGLPLCPLLVKQSLSQSNTRGLSCPLLSHHPFTVIILKGGKLSEGPKVSLPLFSLLGLHPFCSCWALELQSTEQTELQGSLLLVWLLKGLFLCPLSGFWVFLGSLVVQAPKRISALSAKSMSGPPWDVGPLAFSLCLRHYWNLPLTGSMGSCILSVPRQLPWEWNFQNASMSPASKQCPTWGSLHTLVPGSM